MRAGTTGLCAGVLAALLACVASQKWELQETVGRATKRHESCFVVVNGYGYLIGGRARRGKGITTTPLPIERYDLATKTWSTLRWTVDPFEIHHIQCIVYKDKIWMAGGFNGGFANEVELEYLYVYDPAANKWETRDLLPNNPERRRAGGAWVLHNALMYLSHGLQDGHGPGSKIVSYLDIYDPEADEWNPGYSPGDTPPDGPNPRGHTAGGVAEGKLCVAGGRNDSSADFFNQMIPETDCYDPRTNTWTVDAPLDLPRNGAGVGTTCDGEIVVAGGQGNGNAYDVVSYFKPSTGWRDGVPLAGTRHASGIAIGGCDCGFMYVAAGAPGEGGAKQMGSLERYIPNGTSRKCVDKAPSAVSSAPTTTLDKSSSEEVSILEIDDEFEDCESD